MGIEITTLKSVKLLQYSQLIGTDNKPRFRHDVSHMPSVLSKHAIIYSAGGHEALARWAPKSQYFFDHTKLSGSIFKDVFWSRRTSSCRKNPDLYFRPCVVLSNSRSQAWLLVLVVLKMILRRIFRSKRNAV